MKNKLFDVHDDEPVINALLINLSAFKKLYKQDKSIDKGDYKKDLLYIYYYADYNSPYYDREDKVKAICKEVYDNPSKKISAILRDAANEYLAFQDTVERRALEAAISSADTLNSNLKNAKSSNTLYTSLLDEIDKEIQQSTDVLNKIDLFTKRQSIEKEMLSSAKVMGDLLSKLDSLTDTILKLRIKANKSISDIENGDKPKIDDFIDNLISNKNRDYE
jgi:hypothetical protein